MKRHLITINGIVQGVGFRPYIFKLAKDLSLKGYVVNTAEGVIIDIEGDQTKEFIEKLQKEPPPLSIISSIEKNELTPHGYSGFTIKSSKDTGRFTLISPDVSVCIECIEETLSRQDRRYLYPFTNCTNCGPRYTITESVPYDRPNTTMKKFKMCVECNSEYNNPEDRRFHAQPIACNDCGPKVELVFNSISQHSSASKEKSKHSSLDPLGDAIRMIQDGAIIAIKGLGGFHIACDATNEDTVKRLRERKRKNNKPFALMSPDLDTIKRFVHISSSEERILKSRRSPIVLLRKRDDCPLPQYISPNNNYLGFMLPYTPLHHLLFFHPLSKNSRQKTHNFKALVMTSGNLTEEPIVKDNDEALDRLSKIVDAYLLHNREIFMRVDDSVVRGQIFNLDKNDKDNKTHYLKQNTNVENNNLSPVFIRRARGYVPEAIDLKRDGPDILAAGADIKNTFTLTKGPFAIVSQHIGDMENYETQVFFEEVIRNLKSLYRVEPLAIAYDMHPGYFSTVWAKKQELDQYPVQHHHAHIASVMAEEEIEGEVIGVALDGSGYGTDGALWGGEFLIVNNSDFKRFCHFDYIPLLGGEMAIKQPWRTAISLMSKAYNNEAINKLESLGFLNKFGSETVANLLKIKDNTTISPLSSGAGRLFDGISSMLGICVENTFEGEAAMALEANTLDGINKSYGFEIIEGATKIIALSSMIYGIVEDSISGVDKSIISTKFHNTIVDIIAEVIRLVKKETGLNTVALSGGVFQNMYLLKNTIQMLESKGFNVCFNKKVPANDGGISLGQAYILREKLR